MIQLEISYETTTQNNKKWNQRYVNYSRFNGRTPEEQLIKDKSDYPGGCMCGFIIWTGKKWQEWKNINAHFSALTIEDHAKFDAWLTNNVHQIINQQNNEKHRDY